MLLAPAPAPAAADPAGVAHQQAADALGAAQLVRRERDRLGVPRRPGRPAATAAACTASVWNGTPRSAAAAASRCTGCTTPVTLLAHIAAARRSPGRTSRSNSSASTVPSASTGAHTTSNPRRSSSRAGSRTAGCSIALTTSRPGVAPGQAEHGLVVGLGAARGEHDLARLGAQQLADAGTGLLERGPGGAAEARAARRRCRTAPPGRAPSPRGPRRRAASWPRCRGRRRSSEPGGSTRGDRGPPAACAGAWGSADGHFLDASTAPTSPRRCRCSHDESEVRISEMAPALTA